LRQCLTPEIILPPQKARTGDGRYAPSSPGGSIIKK